MSDIQTLYDRNTRFAEDFSFADLGIKPKLSTIVLTCMDSRVDPAHFLRLAPGEVIVIRNSGGRVTDDVVRDLAIIWTITAQLTDDEPELSLAIIHHTDCGLERFANPEIQMMVSERSGLALPTLQQLAIVHHDSAFEEDIRRLRESELIPNGLVVSTHLYEPKSGRLNQMDFPTHSDREENQS